MKRFAQRLPFLALALAFLAQTQPAAPPATPPARTSLAVYPIKPAGVSADLTTGMTALLTARLTPSPRLKVIEEAMLKTVMERQGLNASDACDDTSCQVDIGKLVKAQKMVTGTLSKIGSKYFLSTNLVDIQTGASEFSTEDKCSCSEDQLEDLVSVSVAKIRNHFGEQLPIPALPQAAVVPLPNAPSPASAQTRAVQEPPPSPGQEYRLPGKKGGPMVYVSDFNFYIDKYEVTNQDYEECISTRTCRASQKTEGFTDPRQPVVGVTQDDARTFCQWASKRLPTAGEWGQAKSGKITNMRHPWGNQAPDCKLVNFRDCEVGKTLPVGSKPDGVSPCGALDLSGNVWEWLEEPNWFAGGSWHTKDKYLSIAGSRMGWAGMVNLSTEIGFRCAADR